MVTKRQSHDHLPNWVKSDFSEFDQMDYGNKISPLSDEEKERGLVMRGPFVVELTSESTEIIKKIKILPTFFSNLRFYEDDEGNQIQFGSSFKSSNFEVIGRIRIKDNSFLVKTDQWGTLKVRAITPKDAPLFGDPRMKENVTVEEMADFFWNANTPKWDKTNVD